MNCCDSIIKTLFGLVNFVIFLGGGGLLGIGIYSLTNDDASISELINNDLLTGTVILLIVTGGFIVFVSFFGCCGAFQESTCMLGTFFCLVLVLFVLTAAGAVTGYFLGGDAITDKLQDIMLDSLEKYESDSAVKKSWDTVQNDFECCGVRNSGDYSLLSHPIVKPASCGSHTTGCFQKAVDFIEENSKLLGAVAIVVAVFLLLSMLFSCCIMRSIKPKYEIAQRSC